MDSERRVLLQSRGWRPGPATPYSLLPATRRYEWLAFWATLVGGFAAVNDRGENVGLLDTLLLIAGVIYVVPMLLRELIHRLPPQHARVAAWIATGLMLLPFVAAFLAVALSIVLKAEGRI